MSQQYRTAEGGQIDRSKPLSFTFDGRSFQGFAGDTLASALLANGVHMVGRSFKYHRPRGIFGAGDEDPAGLVQLSPGTPHDEPNVRATTQLLYEGLAAGPQNCWPSLRFDARAAFGAAGRFLPAGFYYKTFMGPPAPWMAFEPHIRNAAGLGIAPTGTDQERYDTINRHCDVLVIGAGAAGLMAARAAAEADARFILCDSQPMLGGWLRASGNALQIGGQSAAQWADVVVDELAGHAEATLLPRTTAVGYYADNFVTLWQRLADHLPPGDRDPKAPRQRLWRIRAKQVILATGLIERPFAFHHNDRPGIMLAGAAQDMLHRYGVKAGGRAVLFAGHDAAWQAAFDLADAGVEIGAIADARPNPDPALQAAAHARSIPVYVGASVVDTGGGKRIRHATILHSAHPNGPGEEARVACDLLLNAAGWVPNVALFSQSRGTLRYDPALMAYRPGTAWQVQTSVGAANGTFDLAEAMADGATAGAAAATAVGFKAKASKTPPIANPPATPGTVAQSWLPTSSKPIRKAKAFVDLQNDVTVRDLDLALQEGYRGIEHVKRYTTVGMGTDQGKTANMNTVGIVAELTGKPVPEVGSTTFRQPTVPVTFGAIAGHAVGPHFHPTRTTPMHGWHLENGAEFEPVGDWLRARAYPRAGESLADAVRRECLATRTTVGVMDASTLGKIDIVGKDAGTFLNRVYTNRFDTLKPGRCRYGLMLGEDGMVSDDGVTACIDMNHYHMTTTTGGAASVLSTLEDYLQTEWPDLDVYMTTVTEQWAVVSLSGPASHAVVDGLFDDLDPDPAGFKFMQWRPAHIEGVPVRVFRVAFTGDLGYEINIRASHGRWLWEKVMAKGAAHGITPYGTDGMHLMRAEKGFIIVGQDTDGTVTPHDLRMDWIVDLEKGDFIGRRSLFRSDTAREGRLQLVGLLTEDPARVLAEGSHLIETRYEPPPPVPTLGHVTSSYDSPFLQRAIALALVADGGNRIGQTLYATGAGHTPVPVKVVEPDFLAAAKGEDGHG